MHARSMAKRIGGGKEKIRTTKAKVTDGHGWVVGDKALLHAYMMHGACHTDPP